MLLRFWWMAKWVLVNVDGEGGGSGLGEFNVLEDTEFVERFVCWCLFYICAVTALRLW